MGGGDRWIVVLNKMAQEDGKIRICESKKETGLVLLLNCPKVI